MREIVARGTDTSLSAGGTALAVLRSGGARPAESARAEPILRLDLDLSLSLTWGADP